MPPTELELIAARDHDTMARFYDHHVAVVGEFCAAVCPSERVDEAVAAVFVNFLARTSEGPSDAVPGDLLRRAARDIAASRMQQHGASPGERADPVCLAMPELLAARVNGELPGEEGPVVHHLSNCRRCQASAARLGQAEVMFPVGSGGEVTELRAAWLQLAGDATPPEPGQAGVRRGGLVHAVRRLARPQDADEGPRGPGAADRGT